MSSKQVNSCARRIGFLDLLLCKTCFEEKDSDRECLIPIEEAINLTTAAIEEDKKGNLTEVLRLLAEAQEQFKLSREPQSARVKRVIKAKSYLYQDHLNKIKDYMINRKKYKQASGGHATSSNKDTGSDEEDATLINQVKDTIMVKRPNIRWSDVAGLDGAKETLQEAVILPIKFPNLFTEKRKPSNGILLFGPPGTGKTFLAKAVATEANNYTFFSVSPTHLVCKWLGESERVMKHLFEVARQQKPSIIFMDYIDSLCNSNSEKESDSIRRMKTEFLLQMQGMGSNTDGIIVLGATNKPWALDEDILRSFAKRIYIPLPDEADRLHILKMNIGDTPNCLTEEDFKQLAKQTDGFSGADIFDLVQDALMQPIRKIQKATHFLRVRGPSRTQSNIMVNDLLTPSSSERDGDEEMSEMDVTGEIFLKPISPGIGPHRAYPHISVYDLLTQWKEEETLVAEQTSTMDVPGEALLEPVISKASSDSGEYSNIIVDDLLTPCSPETHGAEKMSWMDVPSEKLLEPAISMDDMLCSLGNIKSSVNSTYLAQLKKFMEDFCQ